MRFNSISALAAALNLGASGVLSSVIPAIRGIEITAKPLPVEAISCIKDFCAMKGIDGHNGTHCGSIALTITYLGQKSSVEECVGQFRSLIAQDIGSGSLQTQDALYEIATDHDRRLSVHEKRVIHKKKKAKSTKAKTTTTKHTKAKKTKAKRPTTKKTKSKNAKAKKTKSKSSKACPLPRKGKNGKTIHRRCAGDEFYKMRHLLADKVLHWKFNTMEDRNTYNADPHVRTVLDAMNEDGQLDVVKISSGGLTVVGNVHDPETMGFMRGTDPKDFTGKGGNYLLTNGGFFQHKETGQRAYEPAGEDTMVETAKGTVVPFEEPFPLPPDYAEFYDQINGLRQTKVYSGPNLKTSIPGISHKSGIWKYNSNDLGVGILSHASENNERLALIRFGQTHYVVTYTCKEMIQGIRNCGVSTNEFKHIIDLFFTEMRQTGKSIRTSTQAVCMDGGPSISMTWNECHTVEKLSLGGAGDNTPSPGVNGRKVSNLIKIVAH